MSPTTSISYLPAIASQSLGRASHHSIETKLAACARHGFKAIELFFEDLDTASRDLPLSWQPLAPGSSFADSSTRDERLLAGASYIHTVCLQHELQILCLQPFMHYEGLSDRALHLSRIEELKLWFLIADRLNTDLIQIPSNFLPPSQCISDRTRIVSDLREVAELGLCHQPRPIRFAHEALCWGTHTDLWDQAWEVVKAVDRSNFGTCLDTFNIAGRVWADPEQPSGRNPHAAADLRKSLQRLRAEIDVKKIFYVEVVDAERLDQPLTPTHPWHVDGQKPRMSWSRNARLFPFEQKAYLPVLEILKVICEEVGYEGYISFEYFNRSLGQTHASVPEEHAARGEQSWDRLVEYMGWRDDGQSEKAADSNRGESQVQIASRVSLESMRLPWPRQTSIATLWQEESRSITPPVF